MNKSSLSTLFMIFYAVAIPVLLFVGWLAWMTAQRGGDRIDSTIAAVCFVLVLGAVFRLRTNYQAYGLPIFLRGRGPVRIGLGVVLTLLGLLLLLPPVLALFGLQSPILSKAAFGVAYQITLGLLLFVGGLYALTGGRPSSVATDVAPPSTPPATPPSET